MDWDKLRIFHAVADAGSFTKAGDTLSLSQSAVSRQINALEETMGIPLFHRHARGLLLTEQGEMLYGATKEISDRLQMIGARIKDTRDLPEGPLIVTVANFIGSTWLAPKLRDFRERFPRLQLTVILDDKLLNLGMREADVAIRLQEPDQPDLIRRHLTTINFRICGSKEYFAKHGYPKTPEDLKRHTLIAYPENFAAPFTDPNWIFRVAGVDTKTNYNLVMMNSMHTIHKAVVTGAGIAALPEYLIREPDSNLEVILPGIQRPGVDMYYVYPEERRNSKRINILREFLMEYVKETPF